MKKTKAAVAFTLFCGCMLAAGICLSPIGVSADGISAADFAGKTNVVTVQTAISTKDFREPASTEVITYNNGAYTAIKNDVWARSATLLTSAYLNSTTLKIDEATTKQTSEVSAYLSCTVNYSEAPADHGTAGMVFGKKADGSGNTDWYTLVVHKGGALQVYGFKTDANGTWVSEAHWDGTVVSQAFEPSVDYTIGVVLNPASGADFYVNGTAVAQNQTTIGGYSLTELTPVIGLSWCDITATVKDFNLQYAEGEIVPAEAPYEGKQNFAAVANNEVTVSGELRDPYNAQFVTYSKETVSFTATSTNGNWGRSAKLLHSDYLDGSSVKIDETTVKSLTEVSTYLSCNVLLKNYSSNVQDFGGLIFGKKLNGANTTYYSLGLSPNMSGLCIYYFSLDESGAVVGGSEFCNPVDIRTQIVGEPLKLDFERGEAATTKYRIGVELHPTGGADIYFADMLIANEASLAGLTPVLGMSWCDCACEISDFGFQLAEGTIVPNDRTNPVITVDSERTKLEYDAGDAPEIVATALDNVDGEITVDITYPEGAITDNILNEGQWTVTLTATDAAGNTATETVTISVVNRVVPDTTPPVITVDTEQTILTYEAGDTPVIVATASDDRDLNVTVVPVYPEGAITEGKLNVGTWVVTLTAKDSSNNEAEEKTVTITVYPVYTPDDFMGKVNVVGQDEVNIGGGDFRKNGGLFTVNFENGAFTISADDPGAWARAAIALGGDYLDTTDLAVGDITKKTNEVAFYVSSTVKLESGNNAGMLFGKETDLSGNTTWHALVLSPSGAFIYSFVTDAEGNATSENQVAVATTTFQTNTEYKLELIYHPLQKKAYIRIGDGTELVNEKANFDEALTPVVGLSWCDSTATVSDFVLKFYEGSMIPNDRTKPVISVDSERTKLEYEVGDAPEIVATTLDNVDGEIAVDISYPEGAITDNILNEGQWTVTLTATDAAGNIATETVTITVINPIIPDTVPPVITIDTEQTILTYEAGDTPVIVATASDDRDLDVTVVPVYPEGAITEGKLNVGTWIVTLTAKDSSDNEAEEKTVTITVYPAYMPEDFANKTNVVEQETPTSGPDFREVDSQKSIIFDGEKYTTNVGNYWQRAAMLLQSSYLNSTTLKLQDGSTASLNEVAAYLGGKVVVTDNSTGHGSVGILFGKTTDPSGNTHWFSLIIDPNGALQVYGFITDANGALVGAGGSHWSTILKSQTFAINTEYRLNVILHPDLGVSVYLDGELVCHNVKAFDGHSVEGITPVIGLSWCDIGATVSNFELIFYEGSIVPDDRTKPVITVDSERTKLEYEVGDAPEIVATALDNVDGEITVEITYPDGAIAENALNEGQWTVTLTATDAAGNTATETVTITVINPIIPDTTAPVITIDTEQTILTYEAGDTPVIVATASDDRDLNVTVVPVYPEGAITEGKLNVGTWTVTLTAKDSSNNEAEEKTVTITVYPAYMPEDFANKTNVVEQETPTSGPDFREVDSQKSITFTNGTYTTAVGNYWQRAAMLLQSSYLNSTTLKLQNGSTANLNEVAAYLGGKVVVTNNSTGHGSVGILFGKTTDASGNTHWYSLMIDPNGALQVYGFITDANGALVGAGGSHWSTTIKSQPFVVGTEYRLNVMIHPDLGVSVYLDGELVCRNMKAFDGHSVEGITPVIGLSWCDIGATVSNFELKFFEGEIEPQADPIEAIEDFGEATDITDIENIEVTAGANLRENGGHGIEFVGGVFYGTAMDTTEWPRSAKLLRSLYLDSTVLRVNGETKSTSEISAYLSAVVNYSANSKPVGGGEHGTVGMLIGKRIDEQRNTTYYAIVINPADSTLCLYIFTVNSRGVAISESQMVLGSATFAANTDYKLEVVYNPIYGANIFVGNNGGNVLTVSGLKSVLGMTPVIGLSWCDISATASEFTLKYLEGEIVPVEVEEEPTYPAPAPLPEINTEVILPEVYRPKESNLGLILGLSIGIPVALGAVAVTVVVVLKKGKKKTSKKGK